MPRRGRHGGGSASNNEPGPASPRQVLLVVAALGLLAFVAVVAHRGVQAPDATGATANGASDGAAEPAYFLADGTAIMGSRHPRPLAAATNSNSNSKSNSKSTSGGAASEATAELGGDDDDDLLPSTSAAPPAAVGSGKEGRKKSKADGKNSQPPKPTPPMPRRVNVDPDNAFSVLGSARELGYQVVKLPHTGSKTLHSLLRSHPAILDTFEPKSASPEMMRVLSNCSAKCEALKDPANSDNRGRTSGTSELDAFCAELPGSPLNHACGLSFNTQATSNWGAIHNGLVAAGCQRAVFMTRLNVVEHSLSGDMRRRPKDGKLQVDLLAFEHSLRNSIMAVDRIVAAAFASPVPTLLWIFEDYLQQPRRVVDTVQRFLGVEVQQLRDFDKDAERGREGGGDLDQTIKNYAEARAAVERIDASLLPMMTGEWRLHVDAAKAFVEFCSKYGSNVSAKNPVIHLDQICIHGQVKTLGPATQAAAAAP